MSKTLFIGDIHGEWGKLKRLLSVFDAQRSEPYNIVQVGDFGIYNDSNGRCSFDYKRDISFVEGNHEDYVLLRGQSSFGNAHHIKRGHYDNGTLYIGGGFSCDHMSRTVGVDWFPQEELSYREFNHIMSIDTAVHTIVAHDTIYSQYSQLIDGVIYPNQHAQMLEAIFDKFRPSRWIHGHHHKRLDYTYNGCQFHSLDTVSSYKRSQVRRMIDKCTLFL